MIKRIITALVLIPVFVWCIFHLSKTGFVVLTELFVLIGGWEWTKLAGFTKIRHQLAYLLSLGALMIVCFYIYIPYLYYAAAVWWGIATTMLLTYPKNASLWGQNTCLKALMGYWVLVPAWAAMNGLRLTPDGAYKILFLFCLIWGADSGAYFIGRKWGRTKLAPLISPGKSLEGVAGALVTTCLIVAILGFAVGFTEREWLAGLVVGCVTLIASIIGDLFESMMKRNANIKDSGTFFPGHGGVLDRIDSVTAAAPLYALTFYFIQQFLH
jgi:phosphatidate cytidylyltransferase